MICVKNTEITFFFVKFDPMAMTYAKKTEVMFFRENWPADHVLDGKTRVYVFSWKLTRWPWFKRKKSQDYVFSWKLTRRPWLGLKIPKLHFFVKFDPTAMSYAKKTEITFFCENRRDDHDIDGKNPRLRFFVKIDPTTMISAKNTEITFSREIWPDGHD
jgi:hypothetical protein